MSAPQEITLSQFILRGIGKFLTMGLICISLGLTVVTSVSIYSTEQTKSAEFQARQAEAAARGQELGLKLKLKEVETLRLEFERQNQRNIGGDNAKPKKKAGGK